MAYAQKTVTEAHRKLAERIAYYVTNGDGTSSSRPKFVGTERVADYLGNMQLVNVGKWSRQSGEHYNEFIMDSYETIYRTAPNSKSERQETVYRVNPQWWADKHPSFYTQFVIPAIEAALAKAETQRLRNEAYFAELITAVATLKVGRLYTSSTDYEKPEYNETSLFLILSIDYAEGYVYGIDFGRARVEQKEWRHSRPNASELREQDIKRLVDVGTEYTLLDLLVRVHEPIKNKDGSVGVGIGLEHDGQYLYVHTTRNAESATSIEVALKGFVVDRENGFGEYLEAFTTTSSTNSLPIDISWKWLAKVNA